MKLEFNKSGPHQIRLYLGNVVNCWRWVWPAVGATEHSCMYHDLRSTVLKGPPPSETLVTLCKAHAPWHVIIEKLIEEYPDWEPHFMAAWNRHNES